MLPRYSEHRLHHFVLTKDMQFSHSGISLSMSLNTSYSNTSMSMLEAGTYCLKSKRFPAVSVPAASCINNSYMAMRFFVCMSEVAY